MFRKRRKLVLMLCVAGVIAASSVCLLIDISGRTNSDSDAFNSNAPQCGHWAILRSCELLGVPIEMPMILKLLPPKKAGGSMLELREVFSQIGLKSTGVRISFADLVKGSFPAIAYLSDKQHFVVVSKANEDAVHLFDLGGRSAVRTAAEFMSEWDGVLLVIEKEDGDAPLPRCANRNRRNSPCIEFDTLIIDKGNVPWRGKAIPYRFLVRNTGEAPLVIESVKTDCGCLSVETPDGPIAPGEEAVVTMRYSLQGRAGPFKHEAVVKSNDPSVPLVRLTAAGSTETMVTVTPQSVNLGRILPGQTKVARVSVRSAGDYPLDIRAVSCKNERIKLVSNPLSPELAQQLMYGTPSGKGPEWILPNTHVLHISYEAGIEDLEKTVIDTVVIETNIDGYEQILVPVRAYVAALVQLYPSILSFADVDPDDNISKSVQVISLDGRICRIISVRAGDAKISYSTSSGFGQGKTLTLSGLGASIISLSGKTLEIEVELGESSPERFVLKLPLYANERYSGAAEANAAR